MSETRCEPFCGVLRVVWGVPVPVVRYDGQERVYVLSGLRFGNARIITGFTEVPNHSPFPKDTFTVLQKDVREVVETLSPPRCVIGYAHTHPDALPEPSLNDIRGIPRGMIGLVVSGESTHRWYVRGRTIQPSVRVSLVVSLEQDE